MTPAHGFTVNVGNVGATNDGDGAFVVIEFDAEDAAVDPFAFDATIVNVYVVDAVSPDTVIGLVPDPVIPPGDDVATNVTALPPVEPGVNATVAVVVPVAVAVPIVSTCGIDVIVGDVTAIEAIEGPTELVATTVIGDVILEPKPVIVSGEDAPVVV